LLLTLRTSPLTTEIAWFELVEVIAADLRRRPKDIVAAHIFDPERKEIYVEGSRDVNFLNWLAKDSRGSNSRVVWINDVDLGPSSVRENDEDDGGNKQRVLDFLDSVKNESFSIRGFVDLDDDSLLGGRIYPPNVLATDFRDLEGYFFEEENLDRALRLGFSTDKVTAKDFLQSAFDTARIMAAMRLASSEDGWKLPFAKSDWPKKIIAQKGLVTEAPQKDILRALMQRANITLALLESSSVRVTEALDVLEGLEPLSFIHGKDTLRIMKVQLASIKIRCDDPFTVLGSTYDRSKLPIHKNLATSVAFL
jgi:hypothetical protein